MEHEDCPLVLDLVEYFCFSVKEGSAFRGICQLQFKGRAGSADDLVDIVFHDPDEIGSKPRVVVREGGGPPHDDLPVNCVISVPYDDFEIIYSGKATGKTITKMIWSRSIRISSWKEMINFGSSFDYSGACWDRFYIAKNRVSQPILDSKAPRSAGSIIFSSEVFDNERGLLESEEDDNALVAELVGIKVAALKKYKTLASQFKAIPTPPFLPFRVPQILPRKQDGAAPASFPQPRPMASETRDFHPQLPKVEPEWNFTSMHTAMSDRISWIYSPFPLGSLYCCDISDWDSMALSARGEMEEAVIRMPIV